MTATTYHGLHGSITHTPGTLTVTGDLPWLITHPKNIAAADALHNTGHIDALHAYLHTLYTEGIAWERATRRLQNIPPEDITP